MDKKYIESCDTKKKMELKCLIIPQRNSFCSGEGNSVFMPSVCLSSHQQFICDVLFTREIIEPLHDCNDQELEQSEPKSALKIQRGFN